MTEHTAAISKHDVAVALNRHEPGNRLAWLLEVELRARERGDDNVLAAILAWRMDHQLN